MEPAESRLLPADESKEEFRVQVTSKRQVAGQIDKYKDILKTALDGQADVSEETKRVLLQELLTVSPTGCYYPLLIVNMKLHLDYTF